MTYYISKDEQFLELLPSKWWKNFFIKFDEIDTVPIEKWTPHHHLGDFSRRFHAVYQKRFAFTLRGTPSKCTEIFLIKKVIAVLGTSDPKVIKEYFDWVWDKKIIPQKKKILSIGFFANPKFCNEFNLFQKEKETIGRATEIPLHYKSIVEDLQLPIRTFGDLAFAKQALDYSNNEDYKLLFTKLQSVGFKFEQLSGIK